MNDDQTTGATTPNRPDDLDLTVLMIEDDPAVADMYKLRLEVDGYRVTVATDGSSGLELARQAPPDLIYLDVRMPGMDGLEVLEQLRSDPGLSAIPVVMLSNYSEPDLVSRSLSLGAHEYLVKAETNPSTLAANARRWAETRELERTTL